MKSFCHHVYKKTGLTRISRMILASSADSMRPRFERRLSGERRVSREHDYLQKTGGVDRRRGNGRRVEDRPHPVSFIGAFFQAES